MNIASFKEVTEINCKRFTDSPLGKMAEGKSFDKPMSEYDKSLGLSFENLKNCPIEGNNGHWEGERGNSKWYPDREYTPLPKTETGYNNPDNKTWGEILDKYGIDGISFADGEPDFSEVSKGTVEIEPFSDRRRLNFANADIELAKLKGCTPDDVKKWRENDGYTWHESRDMKTMQKIPNEIHANITHSGGISEIQKGNGEPNE